MQDNTLKLRDGRTLGFADYGKSEAIPIFLFHGTPGSRIFGLEDEPFIDQYGIRVIAPYAHAVKKSPEELVRKLLTQFCEWDRNVIENSHGKSRQEDFMLHCKEAFRQGSDGDMLLVSRPWQLDLNTLTVPVFMWHGEADTLMPITPARGFAKLIPGCKTHFIPGAGHLLLESEEIGAQIVARLLSVNA